MTVAVRRYIYNKAYMEVWPSVTDSCRVFSNLAAEYFCSILIIIRNRIERACTYAATAPLTFVVINESFAGII